MNFKYTPDKITKLNHNEVFVFGSNEAGKHGKGAARVALNMFGAHYGKSFGLSGNSFAIPTKDSNLSVLPLYRIQNYVDKFLQFAHLTPELTFFVTKIGCGLAGYSVEQIAPLFNQNLPENVILPKEFYNFLKIS